MSEPTPQDDSAHFSAIFAQLNQQDVEDFYAGYQYWSLRHHIEMLHMRLDNTRGKILENTQRMQEVQPTAIELATLARLQSNGVSDVELLDRMLERGESWLDSTMQRLDYFEQVDDFISDDYTQWCQHALEGAYDWIDSVLDGNATPQTSPSASTDISVISDINDTSSSTTDAMKEEELIVATEELFLQKISADEDEAFAQEITMKRPAITAELAEAAAPAEDTPAELEEASPPLEALQQSEEQPQPETLSPDSKGMKVHSSAGIPQERRQYQKTQTPKRPNVFKRFIGRIWDS